VDEPAGEAAAPVLMAHPKREDLGLVGGELAQNEAGALRWRADAGQERSGARMAQKSPEARLVPWRVEETRMQLRKLRGLLARSPKKCDVGVVDRLGHGLGLGLGLGLCLGVGLGWQGSACGLASSGLR